MSGEPSLITGARPVQLRGSAVARGLLRLFGWDVLFDGLPAQQGVIMVYPHTSNWDFIVGILAKWAVGIPVRFWAKDSLFKAPVFGHWVRWIGGVAVDRGSRKGMVADTAEEMRHARERGEFFWLAVAPEGTRSLTSGWRSGAYRVALEAGVPVGIVGLDYGAKRIRFSDFLMLGGEPEADFAAIAKVLSVCRAKRPEQAGPIKLRA